MDSQAPLKAPTRFEVCSEKVSRCQDVLIQMGKCNAVSLIWVPAHKEIIYKLNHRYAKADELAEDTTSGEIITNEYTKPPLVQL